MISIIITTFKEPKTLPRAIESILDEDIPDSELIVVAPDEETEKIVKIFFDRLSANNRREQNISIKYLKDKGVGKPAALNLAFKEAGGEILVLTDGDVFIERGAIKKLLKYFTNGKVGAVSGRPVSINQRGNIFGYWSHFLTDAADYLRRKKAKIGDYLVCSGYLYAIRNIIKKIPEDTLIEDSVISQMIWQKGYEIAYEPEARVYVKYPDNFKDWIKQKIRTTGGYSQKFKIKNSKLKTPVMRSFRKEIGDGIKLLFTYPKNFKEFWWTILLYLARLYLWILILWQITFFKKIPWLRVESTKSI
jgi:cellulose synthase/poly-beta-1,6-N-acetylglucosamine synthase-like glycosyltransferase